MRQCERPLKKRDVVVQFLRHCEVQQRFADAEIECIQKRKASIARLQQELESHLIPIVRALCQTGSPGYLTIGQKRLEFADSEKP